MKNLFFLAIMLTALFSCNKEKVEQSSTASTAAISDLSELDLPQEYIDKLQEFRKNRVKERSSCTSAGTCGSTFYIKIEPTNDQGCDRFLGLVDHIKSGTSTTKIFTSTAYTQAFTPSTCIDQLLELEILWVAPTNAPYLDGNNCVSLRVAVLNSSMVEVESQDVCFAQSSLGNNGGFGYLVLDLANVSSSCVPTLVYDIDAGLNTCADQCLTYPKC